MTTVTQPLNQDDRRRRHLRSQRAPRRSRSHSTKSRRSEFHPTEERRNVFRPPIARRSARLAAISGWLGQAATRDDFPASERYFRWVRPPLTLLIVADLPWV